MILLHDGIVVDDSGQPSRHGSILIGDQIIESVGAGECGHRAYPNLARSASLTQLLPIRSLEVEPGNCWDD